MGTVTQEMQMIVDWLRGGAEGLELADSFQI